MVVDVLAGDDGRGDGDMIVTAVIYKGGGSANSNDGVCRGRHFLVLLCLMMTSNNIQIGSWRKALLRGVTEEAHISFQCSLLIDVWAK